MPDFSLTFLPLFSIDNERFSIKLHFYISYVKVVFSRQKGSHKIFCKKEFPPISVPCHGKDLKRGLTARILKDAGVSF